MESEIAFTLPRGYVDAAGRIHREGVLRLSTVTDELSVAVDVRAGKDTLRAGVLLLSRVMMRLGDIHPVSPDVIESLFISDFSYLQQLYVAHNDAGALVFDAVCPVCHSDIVIDLLESDVT